MQWALCQQTAARNGQQGYTCCIDSFDANYFTLQALHNSTHAVLQIIRGIAMGLALIMYGREEEAETLIEQMTRDQDPILR